jgi:gamma-glutamyltranspeptidase/glutathione hydrolase
MMDLCVTLLGEFGSMPLGEVAAPALALLAVGRPAAYFDSSLRKTLDALTGQIVDHGTPGSPARDWSADLARTLRQVVEAEARAQGSRSATLDAAADCFRRGDIASQLALWYQDKGGFLRKEDLETHRTTVEEPLALDYHGCRVLKADTWSQGLWLLQALRFLDGFDRRAEMDEAQRCHLIAEVIKLSLADRDHHFGDPRFVDVPTTALLSEEYAAVRRGLIDPFAASTAAVPGDPIRLQPRLDPRAPSRSTDRSTIACITADCFGNMVVMTPSGVGSTAGSGGTTGITHGTRLRSANTRHGHPNCIAPGKRPCVTLSPTLVLKSGRPFLGISIPGGGFQDQVALQLILEFVDRGNRLDDIIARDAEGTPVLVDWNREGPILRVQKPVMKRVADALSERRHRIEPTSMGFRNLGGSLVFVDPDTGELDAFGLHAGAL